MPRPKRKPTQTNTKRKKKFIFENPFIGEQIVKDLLEAFGDGATIQTACGLAGITKEVYYNIQKQAAVDAEVGESVLTEIFKEIHKARARGKMTNLKTIKDAAPKQWQAAAWLLERCFPEEYGRQIREMKHSGEMRISEVNVTVVRSESDADI